MTLLALRNVRAGYDRAEVLRNVSMEVAAGERAAILGRNGVGKTTVVNTFLGIATLHKGSVEFAGQSPGTIRHFTAARHGVAVVPQGRRIVPGLTVRENLLLGAAVRHAGIWELDKVFGLFPMLMERADVAGAALSGGQQQMLAIGRALMANPDLLVLDEPSEGLARISHTLAGAGSVLAAPQWYHGTFRALPIQPVSAAARKALGTTRPFAITPAMV